MSRHIASVDRRTRTVRLALVAVVWLAGLVAGGYALLGIAVRYGCGANDRGLACDNGGSGVGTVLVLAVIGVVTGVTTYALDRSPRVVALMTVGGLVLLAACFAGARALLGTV